MSEPRTRARLASRDENEGAATCAGERGQGKGHRLNRDKGKGEATRTGAEDEGRPHAPEPRTRARSDRCTAGEVSDKVVESSLGGSGGRRRGNEYIYTDVGIY
jgi:hypothetical protein